MQRPFILLAAITTLTSSGYALGEDAPLRKSPYFIDGIHCDGLDGLLNEDMLKRAYASEEIATIGIRTLQQSYCEDIFHEYGIDKFQWVTPEDLEKLSFTLKRAGKFRKVELRIEKSELQNHIHLMGQFTPFEAKNHYALALASGYEAGREATGSRSTTRAEGAIDFNQRGPNNPAPYVLGFKYFNSTAAHPLSLDQIHSNVTLTDDEKAAQVRQNGNYGEVNFRLNFPYQSSYHGLHPYFKTSLNSSQLTDDKNATSNNAFELGTEIQSDPLLPVLTRFSLLYASYSATGSQIYDASTSSHKEKSMLFAGLAQNWESHTISGHLQFYRSLTQEMHYFGDFDMMFHLGEWAGLSHGLGMAENIVRGGVLPEQRFGLPDATLFQLYYRAEHTFSALGGDNKVALKIGSGLYDADNHLTTPYSTSQMFGELSVNRQSADFNLSLAALYGSQRLY